MDQFTEDKQTVAVFCLKKKKWNEIIQNITAFCTVMPYRLKFCHLTLYFTILIGIITQSVNSNRKKFARSKKKCVYSREESYTFHVDIHIKMCSYLNLTGFKYFGHHIHGKFILYAA